MKRIFSPSKSWRFKASILERVNLFLVWSMLVGTYEKALSLSVQSN